MARSTWFGTIARQFLNNSTRVKSNRSGLASSKFCRLTVEVLEDRLAPALASMVTDINLAANNMGSNPTRVCFTS